MLISFAGYRALESVVLTEAVSSEYPLTLPIYGATDEMKSITYALLYSGDARRCNFSSCNVTWQMCANIAKKATNNFARRDVMYTLILDCVKICKISTKVGNLAHVEEDIHAEGRGFLS